MWPRSNPDRIMIIGAPGSGKSTLARDLAAITGLPVFHMDHIHWKPGWVERPKTEKIPLARDVEERPKWIFEGGLSATYETRAKRADLIVWLDFPVTTRLWRVFKRWVEFRGGHVRPDLPDNCPERLDPEFLWFIVSTFRRTKARIMRLLADHGAQKSVRLTSQADIDAFLSDARR